jgi:hemerythrin-like metal-binding protein
MTVFGIPWLQEMSLAAADLDDEHRALLDKVDAVLRANASHDPTWRLMAIGTLKVAAEEHFALEEAKMRELSYPEMEQHCASHQRLLSGLIQLQFSLHAADGNEVALDPYAFLERWFVAHLGNDDRKLAEFLQRQAPEATAAG